MKKIIALIFGFTLCFNGIFAEKENVRMKSETQPLLLVINYPYQVWQKTTSKIHVSLFKPDFTPAEGAVVTVAGKKVGIADKNGVCIFDFFPGSNNSHNLKAVLDHKGETYEVNKSFNCNPRTVSFRSEQIYIYTDRSVYNPGQDILMRMIAWELKGEYKPMADKKIDIILENSKGKTFSGGSVTTDEFGIAALRFPTSENMPEGDYKLVVIYNKVRETAKLRIKRFVPPVINIKHNLKGYMTMDQKSLNVKVDLSWFAGGNMKESKLTFKVLSNKKELLSLTPKASDATHYDFTLEGEAFENLKKKLPNEKYFKAELIAHDQFGRESKVTRDIMFTNKPFQAVLQLDKDSYPVGEKVSVEAKIVDLDGKIVVDTAFKLIVGNETVKAKTNSDGVVTFNFKMPSNSVNATLQSELSSVVISQRSIPITANKPMVSKAKEPAKKAGASTLISIEFSPDFIPIEKIVHYDLTDASGSLVGSGTIPVTAGNKYSAEGIVKANTWGTMLLNLYCCAVKKDQFGKAYSTKNVGFLTEGQYVTLLPDSKLEVKLDGIPEKVRPGAKIKVGLSLDDKEGGEAALGVSVVDMAVISLLDPFEVKPNDRFYNPKLKVIASSGAGVLTWPYVDRNWGNPWRDIAYCNWGWKGPGPIVGGNLGKGAKAPTVNFADGSVITESLSADANSLSAPMEMTEEKEMSFKAYGGKAKKMEAAPGEAGRKPASYSKPMPKITIRTNFPETAFWEPLLKTKDGKAEFNIKIPDAITVQQLNIVATDKKGKLALIRKDIPVKQDLFVQSGLPATMTYGDKILVGSTVRNFTEKAVMATLKFASNDLKLNSKSDFQVRIEPDSSVNVSWEISAIKCGKCRYIISAEGDGFKDAEVKTIYVKPAGLPQVTELKGNLNSKKTWTGTLKAENDSIYRSVTCNIAFPNIFPAIQSMEMFAVYPHGCIEQTCSAALTNIVVLEYGLIIGMDKEKIDEIMESLRYAAARITAMQNSDGGWGWFSQCEEKKFRTNPYLTGYALRTLAELKGADIKVDDKSIEAAIKTLLASRESNGTWSGKEAFFWDYSNDNTDKALTCELFAVITKATPTLTDCNYRKDLESLAKFAEKILDESFEEPLAVANAIEGLEAWYKLTDRKDGTEKIAAGIDQLIKLKRKGYWEPHWYHAYGGMVELNARILELLKKYNKGKYNSYLREGVAWLMSTREAFGAWHNTMGTVAAVRALMKISDGQKEVDSTVEVFVNGRSVTQVQVDARDPFLSAAKLRFLDLSEFICEGENKIEVKYNGKLDVPVMIEMKEWSSDKKITQELKNGLKVTRKAPEKVSSGDTLNVTIKIESPKTVPFLLVEESIPSNTICDILSLEELKKSGKITDFKTDFNKGIIYLYLKSAKDTELTYKLIPVKRGTCNHAGTKVTGMYDKSIVSFTEGSNLTVID